MPTRRTARRHKTWCGGLALGGTAGHVLRADVRAGSSVPSVVVSAASVPGPSGRWMSTLEACTFLGVTLRALYRFIDKGQLPAYRMGRVYRLRRADVEEFDATTGMTRVVTQPSAPSL